MIDVTTALLENPVDCAYTMQPLPINGNGNQPYLSLPFCLVYPIFAYQTVNHEI